MELKDFLVEVREAQVGASPRFSDLGATAKVVFEKVEMRKIFDDDVPVAIFVDDKGIEYPITAIAFAAIRISESKNAVKNVKFVQDLRLLPKVQNMQSYINKGNKVELGMQLSVAKKLPIKNMMGKKDEHTYATLAYNGYATFIQEMNDWREKGGSNAERMSILNRLRGSGLRADLEPSTLSDLEQFTPVFTAVV